MLRKLGDWSRGKGRRRGIGSSLTNTAMEERTAVTTQGTFLLESGSSGHIPGIPQKDRRVKTACDVFFFFFCNVHAFSFLEIVLLHNEMN